MEPLEELPAAHPGSLRGHGSRSEGPGGTIRAGWQGRESAVAPGGQPPRSGCSQGVQSVPGAGRARPGLTARGAGPTRLGEPLEARRDRGQEAAPSAAAAASPATCADLEKQSLGPAAARPPGQGGLGSPALRDPAAAPGCAPNPATRAAHGEERLRGKVLPGMDNSKQHQPLYQTCVPAAVPEQGLLQPAPALCVSLWLPRSPVRGGHP